MINCVECKVTKLEKEFPYNIWGDSSSGRLTTCRRCGGKDKVRSRLITEPRLKPCTDCQQQFPLVCMEFDHLPGTTKKFNICWEFKKFTIQQLKEEIAKCEVVCANCHKIRTAERRNRCRGLS